MLKGKLNGLVVEEASYYIATGSDGGGQNRGVECSHDNHDGFVGHGHDAVGNNGK